MFEKVGAATSARQRWLQPGWLAMAAAAHVVFVAGIASIPRPRISPPRSVEVATFLVQFQADRAPAIPARAHASAGKAVAVAMRQPNAGTGDERGSVLRPRVAPQRTVPTGFTAPGAPPELVPAPAPALPLPETVPVPTPADPAADIRALVLLGNALDGDPRPRVMGLTRPGAGGVSGGESGLDAEPGANVVDAEMLAELPRMLNARELARRLTRLYPARLRNRGVQGQVAVSFIIGLDGRVEQPSVRVLAADHPGLVAPSLRALQLMRFRPAKLNGEPVRVRASLPIRWELRQS